MIQPSHSSFRLTGLLIGLGTLLTTCPMLRAVDSAVVFNEVMYHPSDTSGVEWIELYNQMAVNMDLSGWRITGGVNFTFPVNTVLPSGGYLVIAGPAGSMRQTLGPWTGKLDNSGEAIELKNLSGRVMDRLSWSDSGRWPLGADGSGASLSKLLPDNSSALPEAWSASWQTGGTPGKVNFPEGPVLGPAQPRISTGSGWIFLQGADPGAEWAGTPATAGQGGWQSGTGAFSFDETAPPLPVGTVLANPLTTALPVCYFQKTFTFDGDPAQTRLSARLLIDDGAVIYLNGREIARRNLPAGPVTPSSRAQTAVGNAAISEIILPVQDLLPGSNLLAVSLHDAPPDAPPPAALTRVEEGGTMDSSSNLALASLGAVAFAKDLLPGFAPTHTIPNLNNGTSGNASSWIGNSSNSFCGIRLGATPVPVASIAFGRDNTGALTDRTSGTYTVQYTTVANPSATTPAASWTSIGTLNYGAAAPPLFTQPSRRHRYDFPAVSATGVRLIATTNGICIDELEVYGPRLPDMVFDLALSTEAIIPQANSLKLVINEIAGVNDPLFRIELKNEGTASLNPAGMKLGKAALPPGLLAPGGLLVMDESQLGFRPADGDRLFLFADGGQTLLDAANAGPGLKARYQGRLLNAAAASFGAENALTLNQGTVINEIMYHFPPRPSQPAVPPTTATTVLLPLDATWRYKNSNTDPGLNWAQIAHPAGTPDWQSGPGLLGFSTATTLPTPLRTPFVSTNAPTCYFETDFELSAAQLATLGELRLEYAVDDGAAFYINGVELKNLRIGLPPGPNLFTSNATVSVANATLSAPKSIAPAGLNLQAGLNRLSIEVHNQTPSGSDLICGARLSAISYLTPGQAAIPVTSDPEEWIELHHQGSTPRNLTGWKLTGAIGFQFPPGTIMEPGGYLVIARNAALLKAKWPETAERILGDFSSSLGNAGARINLLDAAGNPADEVSYPATGLADGGGSSLELRDPHSDNSLPSAWADSDETAKSSWQTFRYRLPGSQKFGPTTWNEMRVGMLDVGDCLIDELSVKANPDTAATEVIQNGNFETTPAGAKWRFLGNHRSSSVIEEPGNAANHVLRLSASGPAETNHNHAESTFVSNRILSATATHEVSFRARWLGGTNQLNLRGYYQKIARTVELPIPARLGTPGAVNSRFLANAGPALTALTHSPAIPAPGAPVTVSLTAADPDGVASLTLRYRLNGATTFNQTPLTESAGRWTAVLPGQSAGAILQFYVEATDQAGATSFGPAKGPDSRALIPWVTSTPASNLPAHELRLLMLNADRDFLLADLNKLSTERIPGTVIYRGREIYYDAGVRLQGTAAGRVRDGDDYLGYDIGFPPDHLFRGLQESVGVDRSGRSPVVRQQDEIYVRQTFQRAGIPCPVDDLCYFVAPQSIHTGTAILQLATYSGLWADSQFDKQGTVFNYDFTYDPTTTLTSSVESLKPPVPFIHVTTDMLDLGDDKEQYRGPFDIRAGKRRDNYSGVMALCKTMALDNTQLAIQAPQVLDLDEVLRCTALVNLWGIADTYYTSVSHHNLRLFTPDDGRGITFLPWDMDFTMYGATDAALMPSGTNLGRLISNVPTHRRLYFGHVRNLIATVFNPAYLTPWLSHYGSVVGQNYGGTVSYLTARAAAAARQYPANALFAITTNGGAAFSTAADEALLEGTGWIDIRELRRAGSQDSLSLTWTTDTKWRTVLPLNRGENTISLEARSYDGTLLGTRTITITNTLPPVNPCDCLRITELHYHPAGPATPAELAASTSASDFEFLEVKNLAGSPISLKGVHTTAGVDFTFPDTALLGGNQYAVIVRKRSAFEARYGPGINILGEYPTDAFSNGGETVTLTDATGGIIQSFSYSDAWFPHTDGPGWSMVAAAENALTPNLNQPAAWAISAQIHGNPGAPNGPIFSHEFEGWRHQQFTPEELADPLLSGPSAGPGGLSNLLRYALALPRSGTLPASSSGTLTPLPLNQINFSYRRLKQAFDLTYAPEISSDLKTWLPGSTTATLSDHGDGTETATVQFTTTPPAAYVRLRITLTP